MAYPKYYRNELIRMACILADVEAVSATLVDKTAALGAEANMMINHAFTELFDLVYQYETTDMFLLSHVGTIGAGVTLDYNEDGATEVYAGEAGVVYLPVNHLRVRQVFWIPAGTTAYVPLRPADTGHLDRSGYGDYGRYPLEGQTDVGYYITSELKQLTDDTISANVPKLRLTPTDVEGTVEVYYSPKIPHAVYDATLASYLWRKFEEYAVYTMAVKLLQKEGSDTTALETRRARVRDRVIAGVSSVNSAHTTKISDRSHLEGVYSG
jgi:hypothetical protein